jgi:hypothetical protein
MAQTSPITASLISSLVGLVVVTLGLVLIMGTILEFIRLVNYLQIPESQSAIDDVVAALSIGPNNAIVTGSPGLSASFLIMRPAFIIHLWLPLFAISSLVVRLIYLLFRAVEKAQWFLKQGDAHPLKAIGIVATIIVFGSAMLVKEAWTVL